jgi:pimeloyl-ACP methyl ester carboxylesterase
VLIRGPRPVTGIVLDMGQAKRLERITMTAVHHRYATVAGRKLFYREAGPADAPVILLLHGFPTSSFIFWNLIPVLAQRYHVIAPDHLGFGLSDMPSAGEFTYTFDALTELTSGLLEQLGVTRSAAG